MRIVYVYDGDWPRGATRVAKETRSLARAGHTVHLVARNSLGEPRTEDAGWMTVHRLPAWGPDWFNRSLNFPFFFNPIWVRAIERVARQAHAECVIVADLPLALTAIWVGKRLGLPV